MTNNHSSENQKKSLESDKRTPSNHGHQITETLKSQSLLFSHEENTNSKNIL